MLGAAWLWMFKALQGTLNVAGNGDVDSLFDVVPDDGEATVASAFPILTDRIQFTKGGHEVFGVGFVHVFDTEVINGEGKNDVTCIVFRQAVGDGGWGITIGCKEGSEAVVSNLTGLRKAVHAAANLDVNIVVMDERGKGIFSHDGWRNDGDRMCMYSYSSIGVFK
jgi:hypothetical protein